jgi:multiple sugar transport system permease protein
VKHPGTTTGKIVLGIRLALSYLLLIAGAILMVVPFIWMISSSLKPEGDVFAFPPEWIPNPAHWDNYAQTFAIVPFAQFGLNSLQVAILSVIGALFSCSTAAYCFARMRFPGRDLIFLVLLATLMVPGQVTVIPIFLIMRSLGLVNTLYPLFVPQFLGGAFGVFLLRQFFMTMPTELEDAARIDGAGDFGIYWKIFLPLAKPALASLGVFVFLYEWNDLLGPVIYLNEQSKMTLPVGLTFFQGEYSTAWNLLMAGSLISLIPILLLFAVAQRYFVQGIVMSGIKG